jgi:hypothetical protein
MDSSTFDEHKEIARRVLGTAIAHVRDKNKDGHAVTGSALGRQWISGLHAGFSQCYIGRSGIEIFSRTRSDHDRNEHECGKTSTRQEFLFDLAVVEVERRAAPFQTASQLQIVTGCLWQVESEVGLNSRAVTDDLGKLVLGSAAAKLLIVAQPTAALRLEKWLDHIRYASQYIQNDFLLAVIPSYSESSSSYDAWRRGTVCAALYDCKCNHLGSISAND